MKELIEIQSELKAPKNQLNKFGGYKYRSAEDILEAVKPHLKNHGCFLTLSDHVEMLGDRFYIQATAIITNGKGESVVSTGWAREEASKKGMDASQITGAASSYARKYALNGLFCIDDTTDADSQASGEITETDINAMILDISSSSTRKELEDKFALYKKYDGEDKKITTACRIRAKELGV